MTRSLSILLPVYNAQPFLEGLVEPLLEIVPDLTHDFEVLLIDNGSTDETIDAARHLASRYPQLFLLRYERRIPREAILDAACALARGDVLFIRDEQAEIDVRAIGKLWRQLEGRHAVCASPAASTGSPAALGWPNDPPARSPAPACYMIRRSLAAEMPWALRNVDAVIAELSARGYDCAKIAIGSSGMLSSPVPRPHQQQMQQPAPLGGKPQRPRRPNYLARILAITAGN